MDTRKSSDGFLVQLYGGLIDWKASKQRTVTTLSIEAELLALSSAAKEVIWWRRFFDGIRFDPEEEYSLNCDNLQTIRLMTKDEPRLDTKLKYIDIHHHWLRQEVQAKWLKVDWLNTDNMPADGLTKSLTKDKYKRFIKQFNLVDISDKL